MVVLFNNVSYQNLNTTENEIEKLKKERIDSYKLALSNVAKRFYRTTMSDLTLLGGSSWQELKTNVCNSEDYQNEKWF